MSTAIVRQDQVVSSLEDVQRVARLLAMSNYFDAKGDGPLALAQIATKILAGREMGYGPFASVQGIHVIQSKPVISANLMAAAVKRSGRYDYRVRKLDNDGCEIEFFEVAGGKRESLGKSGFTRDDAKAAGLLGKDNWSKFARNMFFARALSNGIRWYAPDVFDGSAVYTPDELGVTEDTEGNAVIAAPPHAIQEEAQPQSAPPAATVTTTGNGGGAGNGGGNGHNGGDAFKRYQAAKAAAAKSGKFSSPKHLDAAWGKMFSEYQAHEPSNADRFLSAWAVYVEAHEPAKERRPADVPPMEDAPEINPDGAEIPA